uniref:hypothetical protein n=2 Tax=Candidatus Enterovibrio escicola TaxID=1927127 RepID=UPI0018F11D80|nr:hypothetical protein [Candidatus Enterovibrio escacola]
MGKHLISSGVKQQNKPFRLSISKVMTIVIACHQARYRDFKTYYIHFVCRYLTVRQGRQGLPSLIRPSYRLVTTYAFSDIRFLNVPRSEEKERWGGSTEANHTLLSMTKVALSQSKE